MIFIAEHAVGTIVVKIFWVKFMSNCDQKLMMLTKVLITQMCMIKMFLITLMPLLPRAELQSVGIVRNPTIQSKIVVSLTLLSVIHVIKVEINRNFVPDISVWARKTVP